MGSKAESAPKFGGILTPENRYSNSLPEGRKNPSSQKLFGEVFGFKKMSEWA